VGADAQPAISSAGARARTMRAKERCGRDMTVPLRSAAYTDDPRVAGARHPPSLPPVREKDISWRGGRSRPHCRGALRDLLRRLSRRWGREIASRFP
jgi:hypothetical protein